MPFAQPHLQQEIGVDAMRAWIGDKLYDTETAPVVASVVRDGEEIVVHRKRSGSFFLHRVVGGGAGRIVPVSYDAALDVLRDAYGSEGDRLMERSLPDSATVTLKGDPAVKLNAISSRKGRSKVEIIEELIMRFGSGTEKMSASDTDE